VLLPWRALRFTRGEADPSHVHYFNVGVVSASDPCSMIAIDISQVGGWSNPSVSNKDGVLSHQDHLVSSPTTVLPRLGRQLAGVCVSNDSECVAYGSSRRFTTTV
jgi:hypothetical protein